MPCMPPPSGPGRAAGLSRRRRRACPAGAGAVCTRARREGDDAWGEHAAVLPARVRPAGVPRGLRQPVLLSSDPTKEGRQSTQRRAMKQPGHAGARLVQCPPEVAGNRLPRSTPPTHYGRSRYLIGMKCVRSPHQLRRSPRMSGRPHRGSRRPHRVCAARTPRRGGHTLMSRPRSTGQVPDPTCRRSRCDGLLVACGTPGASTTETRLRHRADRGRLLRCGGHR